MGRKAPARTLWSTRDIARRFGLSKKTVESWKARNEDFPEPAFMVSGYIPVYDPVLVARFISKKKASSLKRHPKEKQKQFAEPRVAR